MKKSTSSYSHHRINHSLTSPNLLNSIHQSNPSSLTKLLCKTIGNNNQVCSLKFQKQNNRYNSNENCINIAHNNGAVNPLGGDGSKFPKKTPNYFKSNVPPTLVIPDSNFDKNATTEFWQTIEDDYHKFISKTSKAKATKLENTNNLESIKENDFSNHNNRSPKSENENTKSGKIQFFSSKNSSSKGKDKYFVCRSSNNPPEGTLKQEGAIAKALPASSRINRDIQYSLNENTLKKYRAKSRGLKICKEAVGTEIIENSADYLSTRSNFYSDQNNKTNESELLNFVCMLHPEKKAKYFLRNKRQPSNVGQLVKESDSSNFFCSKCAIFLAGQGHEIQEIQVEEENVIKKEIEEFLAKIEETTPTYEKLTKAIDQRRLDVTSFYERQTEKLTRYFGEVENFIQQEKASAIRLVDLYKNKSIEQLKGFEKELKGNNKELEKIKGDIHLNFANIIKKIDLEPFREIMKLYSKKLSTFQDFLSTLDKEKINVQGVTGVSQKELIKLKSSMNPIYKLVNVTTPLISGNGKKHSDQNQPRNSDDVDTKASKGSLYVSFENKEIFENAINSSIESGNITEFDSKSMNKIKKIVYGNSKSMIDLHMNQNTESTNFTAGTEISQSFEKRKGFSNIKDISIEDFEPKISEPDPKTPKSALVRKRRNLDTSLLLNGSQHRISSDKDTNGTENKCDTKKYMNILDKISENQTKTSQFYSDLLKNHPLISPRYSKTNEQENASPKNERHNDFLATKTTLESEKSTLVPNKEIKNFENFFVFIENKIKDESKNSNTLQSNYQKTLFCSPDFKH